MRRALVAVALAGIIATAAAFGPGLWDPRLSQDEAERLVDKRVGVRDVVCRRQENDGSLSMDDVDYFCESTNAGTGWWIGTDDDRITDIQPAG